MSAAVSVSLRPAAPTAGAVLDIDLSAVGANTRRFAALTPALLAVVKADGYGLGATQIARTALSHGAIGLGVTSLAEALALRADGLTAPILSWLNPVDGDFAAGLAAGVHLAVGSIEHLDAVCRAARRTGRAASVHLAVDCGMARDGSPPLAWPALAPGPARPSSPAWSTSSESWVSCRTPGGPGTQPPNAAGPSLTGR